MATVDMAVNSGARLWTPFKELYEAVDTVLLKKQMESVHDLEVILRRHKPDFLALLKSPEKNSLQREMVKKATKEGLPVYTEQRTQILSQDFIEEALIFSDLFNINEFAAVEFLLAGQNQQPNYPGLGRGLVAVLLYYDGQRALVNSLHVLLQAREGRMWTMANSQEVTNLITNYTDQLIEDGLVGKILDLVKNMDLDKEVEKLEKERALGPPKHRKQVIDLYKEIRLSLAECIFSMAAQQPLNEADTLRLIGFLREDCKWNPDGTLEPASLCLLITLLYCFDNRLLEHEDKEDIIQNLPMVNNEKYIRSIHQLLVSGQQWSHPEIKAVACFAWALSLRQLYISQHPCAPGVNEFCEEDENIVFSAIKDKVFSFLRTAVIAAPHFFEEEFYVGRLHGLLTDFIIHMPLKVTELRNLGDEAARIIMVHLQNGKEPPSSLSRDFEELLKLLAELYGQDKLNLEYGLEYWCPAESTIADSHLGTSALHHRPPQRQVALYKFVRLAGDLLPASLYVPYIQLLIGLANSPQCAWHCFSLLKMNGMNSGSSAHMVSWDHIFISLNQYYTNLRREVPSQTFGGHHAYGGITPQEQEALIAVLQLTECIANQNKECRIAIYENQQWMPTTVLFGLAGCSIPAGLKAQILLTLAALGKSPEIAASFWQSLEASQIVVTVSTSRHQQIGGIQVELEEVESRNEEYVLSRSFLTLINTLINSSIPQSLGAGYRTPGFGPYLDFIIDSLLLKCLSRAYKKPAEKWQVAIGALEILYKILCEHKIQANHFVGDTQLAQGDGSFMASKPPGHTLMILMLNDSGLLRLILQILNDALIQFAAHIEFPGKALLEKACLLCLRLIEITLEKEDGFLAALRESGSSTVVVCMDRLLRSVNPSTGKPDHLVNIAKFVLYNDRLYEHALSTMKILFLVCRSASVQSDLVALFTTNEVTHRELLQGFVECLENEEEETNPSENQEHLDVTGIHNAMRKHLMQLLLNSIDYPAPNVAHFLMGFDLRKPVSKTNLQDPGVLGCPRTCLHSLITILNRGVGTRTGPRCIIETPQLAELAYHLIYALCSNKETSPPTMRYLRTVHDFFYRQLKHLPFTGDSLKTSVRNHQTWLLKSIAIELRLSSLNRHRSHTQRLMKLLLEDIEVDQISVMQNYGSEENDYTYSGSGGREASISQYPTMASSRMMTGTQTRRKILRILDSLDFTLQCPPKQVLEFFEERLVEQVIKSCSKRPKNGPSVCDVKALHRILIGELSNLQGTTMAGQRGLILREVEMILEQVVARNTMNENLYSKYAAFESWRQVTEVLVTTCSHELLDKESQQTLLFELLQDLLIKVADNDTLQELTAPVAGVVLVVMANLRRCFLTESLAGSEELQQNGSQSAINDSRAGTRTLFATSLHIVLKGILDYIQKSCGSQQKVRMYLYGSLLYYLQIAQKPTLPYWVFSETDAMGVSKVLVDSEEGEFDNLSRENLSIIMSYSDSLLDILCKDTCDGHHVGRLLSLSVLDCILTLDKRSQCLNFMISKGYLQHLIDSILSDDPHLQNLLNPSVDSLKHLYSFEGRMTFFNRVASTPAGAYSLLRHGLMKRLAECEVFAMRPEHERGQAENIMSVDEDIAPSPLARYHRLLFAVLKLCLAIISSVGVENSNIAKEILMFIISHGDVFHAILRDRHTFHNLGALQELELTTAVISKVAVHAETDQSDLEGNPGETSSIEFYGQVNRMQREMLCLLQRFVLSEKVLKELQNLDNKLGVEGDDLKAEIILTYKKIITNVVAYCRLLITKSGQNAQFCKIIFSPSLEERNPGQDLRTGDDVSFSYVPAAGRSPSLTIIVQHLKQCTSQFTSVYDNHQQLKRKLSSVTDLTSEDLKEYSGVADIEKIPTQQQQELAKRRLVQIIGYRFQELQNYSYIIENCLFILWRHLEYYLLHCVPLDQQPSLYQAQHREQWKHLNDLSYSASPAKRYESGPVTSNLTRGISSEELDALKSNAPSVIGESLMKKILEINQCFGKTRSHYSFVEAVVRQIRRLLRLHTSNSYEK